jgi:hypothetical protein
MTLGEAETKRLKAIEFLRRLGKDEDADRFEEMSAEDYAEHKGVELLDNPQRRNNMARGKSKADLEFELDEAKDYIEQLEGKLDDIAGIAADDEDEEDEDDEHDEGNGGEDDDLTDVDASELEE